jgi:resuscitation-promoting factor RpfA
MSARSHRRSNRRFTAKHAVVPVLAAAAIGGTVALSQPASASTANWDAIAQKESSGNWSINTGNGYGGGLQISPVTSAALGGPSTTSGIAALSKAQQIALAEKILAVQGPHAWPNTYVSGGSSSSPSTSSAPTVSHSFSPAPSSHRSTATTLPTRQTPTVGVHQSYGYSPFFTASQVGVFQTQVAVWQAKMDSLGYHVVVDGHYGPKSAAAARQIQIDKHILIDGIVGPQTWHATFG